MTIGLKTPNSYYIELVIAFPPRPITNEEELIATQNRVNFILDKENLNQDDKNYIKVLGLLIYEYEEKYEQLPKLKNGQLLQALLEEANLQPKDLVGIFENESIVEKVLQEKRKLTKIDIDRLSQLFNICQKVFDSCTDEEV